MITEHKLIETAAAILDISKEHGHSTQGLQAITAYLRELYKLDAEVPAPVAPAPAPVKAKRVAKPKV